MQRSWPAGRACSLLLSPCRVCLFLSASQPPLPPPHSAWGVIKSVYACPQSKEIGIHTHKHKHPRSHLKRHALTHSATVETQIYRRIYLPTSPRQAFEHKTSNIYSVLSVVCHKITFSQPVTLRPVMAANLLYLQPCALCVWECECACVCKHISVIKHVHIRSWMSHPCLSSSSALCLKIGRISKTPLCECVIHILHLYIYALWSNQSVFPFLVCLSGSVSLTYCMCVYGGAS